jgi:hypothetical protein
MSQRPISTLQMKSVLTLLPIIASPNFSALCPGPRLWGRPHMKFRSAQRYKLPGATRALSLKRKQNDITWLAASDTEQNIKRERNSALIDSMGARFCSRRGNW